MKIITFLVLLLSAFPFLLQANDEVPTSAEEIIICHNVDPRDYCNRHHRSPAYIPFQTSYDTHYIYVSSRTSIFGTYKIKDNGEEALAEGVLTVTPGNRQTINISTLPEGEYTLEMTIGEQTFEGSFYIE